MEEKVIGCPCCGGVMEKGIFHATGANNLLWVPKDVKLPAIMFNSKKLVNKGAVEVEFKRVSSNAYVSAFCCKGCQAILLEKSKIS